MTAKEFLSQTFTVDKRINSKLRQIEHLNELATKCTSVWSDMPKSPNRRQSPMADAVDRIIDLQSEINADIDTLVSIKQEIHAVIKAVDNDEYKTLLEQRYLCCMAWEDIASMMSYNIRWVHKIHGKALLDVQAILDRPKT